VLNKVQHMGCLYDDPKEGEEDDANVHARSSDARVESEPF